VPERAGLVLSTAIIGTLAFDIFAQGALKRYLVDAEAEAEVRPEPRVAREGAT
jgi:hypothetical protein